MHVNSNGVVITKIQGGIKNSSLGDDYVVTWDAEGLPMHINRNVIDEMVKAIYGEDILNPKPAQPVQPVQQQPIVDLELDSPFIN